MNSGAGSEVTTVVNSVITHYLPTFSSAVSVPYKFATDVVGTGFDNGMKVIFLFGMTYDNLKRIDIDLYGITYV